MPAAQNLPPRLWWLSLAAVVVAGLAVRLLFLGDKALWLDESYSAWFSGQSWRYLWREVPQFETHPPLYYTMLKLWRSFGSTEAALRMLSVLANVATILLIALAAYIAAPLQHRRALAIIAAFLFATSPMQMAYAQEARPYTLLVLAVSLALVCAIWIVMHAERAGQPLSHILRHDGPAAAAYLGLGLGMAMQLWMHNIGAVFMASLGSVLVVWWTRQSDRRGPLFINLLAALLLALALYAPNVPILLSQMRAVSENFWLTAPSVATLCRLMFQVYGQWQLLFGTSLPQYAVQLLLALPLALLGIAGMRQFYTISPERRWVAWLIMAMASGPTLLLLAITYTVQPVLMERTLIPVQVAWVLLCAAAPLGVERRRMPLVWGAIVIIGVLNVITFAANQATPERRNTMRPWRAIAERVAGSDAAAATVVLLPNDTALPLGYYDALLGSNLAMLPLPDRYPVRGNTYSYPAGGRGVPSIDSVALERLEAATAGEPTVWLITRFESLFDPQRLVRRALSERFPCAESINFGLIIVTRFDRFETAGTGACP